MNFFSSRSPRKTSKKPAATDDDPSSRSQSPPKRATPAASSSSSSSASASKPTSKSHENSKQGSSSSGRNSRNFGGKTGPNPPKPQYDLNTHPLNLPPELRRLSTLSNKMAEPDRMEIDSEAPAAQSPPYIAPTSPPPPPANVPIAFDTPKPPPKSNGTNGTNGEGPIPPPHKSNPTSPAPTTAPPADDAEAFKTAGNKFYKAREYRKAIEEYTKGKNVRVKIRKPADIIISLNSC